MTPEPGMVKYNIPTGLCCRCAERTENVRGLCDCCIADEDIERCGEEVLQHVPDAE